MFALDLVKMAVLLQWVGVICNMLFACLKFNEQLLGIHVQFICILNLLLTWSYHDFIKVDDSFLF